MSERRGDRVLFVSGHTLAASLVFGVALDDVMVVGGFSEHDAGADTHLSGPDIDGSVIDH